MYLTDPLALLQSSPSFRLAFDLFRAGATLCQDTQLKRWWLRLADGKETDPAPDSDGRFWDLQEFGVEVSSVGIPMPAGASEAAATRYRTWRFAAEEFASELSTWARARECAADWNARAGKFSGDLFGLSGEALKLIKFGPDRTVRIDMRPEHYDALMELNAAGLLKVDPCGWAVMTLSKKQLQPLLKAARWRQQAAAKPHVFLAPGPVQSTSDPLDGLTSTEGQKVLDLFKKGAQLNIWRWSSPHNHWLSKGEREVYMWSNDRGSNDYRAAPRPGALLPIGRRILAEGVIPHCGYGIHRDGGSYGKEIWVFDQEAFDTAQVRWASAQRAAAAWQAAAGPFTGDLSSLSENAMAALRALKKRKYWNLPVHFALFPVLAELNAAGLIEVQPQGWASPRLALQDMKLPKGPLLELVYLEEGSEHPLHGEKVGRLRPHWHELQVPAALAGSDNIPSKS